MHRSRPLLAKSKAGREKAFTTVNDRLGLPHYFHPMPTRFITGTSNQQPAVKGGADGNERVKGEGGGRR